MSTRTQHPLGKDTTIPKQIEAERLAYLTNRIRNGTITNGEREELARGFIRLALKIASRYGSRNPSKSDDFSSAALFGIAYALDTAEEKLVDDNITAWVIANIRRFIRRFYETDHMVRTPSTTYHKAKKEGRELAITSVIVLDSRELNSPDEVTGLHPRMRGKSSGSMYDLREILQLSTRDDKDRTILKMRMEGFTDTEIAAHMQLSTSYIQRKRAEMEARFEKLNED